jgi:spore maturation protein CgeB
MPRKLRIAYFAHTLRSDWNNGNAHFLRGLMRSLVQLGHDVKVFEAETGWSIYNLRTEPEGLRSLEKFLETYADLNVQTYLPEQEVWEWREWLRGVQVIILHEWNPPELAQMLLSLRQELGYKLLFHDTHHRASSSPENMERSSVCQFDGVLAFGEVLSAIYRERFRAHNVWTFHEAADISVFHPLPEIEREDEIVWVGNWGEGERSSEICEFLLKPAARLRQDAQTTIYGVRYPPEALAALESAGIRYLGYLANLETPFVYAGAKATVHIPRQQYAGVMTGIPTIRVFEALACGIPLVSAPWHDTESLFRPSDLCFAGNTSEMIDALHTLLRNPAAAEDQAARGLETILARHTCSHRAVELTAICEELLA